MEMIHVNFCLSIMGKVVRAFRHEEGGIHPAGSPNNEPLMIGYENTAAVSSWAVFIDDRGVIR